ncbi:MAG TPA: flagellar brake domain-containing protein [Bacilli bacterium]
MLPKISQTLFLQVANVDETEEKEEYKSRISDVGEESFSIDVPIDVKSGKLHRVYVGDTISAYYVSNDGAKYYFNSEVMGFTNDVLKLVIIKKPQLDAITKVQRRTFLRVTADLEVAVKLSEHFKFLAITEDVGGGGISFVCDGSVPIKQKDVVSCWLLVPYRNGSIDHVPFKGDLVRIKPLDTGKQLVMLSYTEITDPDRQKVIRYCFERQLDFRKK